MYLYFIRKHKERNNCKGNGLVTWNLGDETSNWACSAMDRFNTITYKV